MIHKREPHKHIFYSKSTESPPTVFVDNNYGYILFSPITSGYKNISLKYSSIKYCAGLNIYCSNESLGVCLFKNETMISVTDASFSEFFGIDLPEDVSVSVLMAIRIGGHIVISAIANVNPNTNKVLMMTKNVEIDGAILACPTVIYPEKTLQEEIDVYSSLYGDDFSYSGQDNDEVDFVTYEKYFGSTGFGDIGFSQFEFGNDRSESVPSMYEEIIDHLCSFDEKMCFFKDKGIYAISESMYRGKPMYVGVSKEKVFLLREGHTLEYEFDGKMASISLDNVINSPVLFQRKYNKGLPSSYATKYYPIGIIREYESFERMSITRLEEEDEEFFIREYIISKSGKDEPLPSSSSAENGIISPSGEIKIDSAKFDYNDCREIVGIGLKSINTGSLSDDSDTAGRNHDTIHRFSEIGSVPWQEDNTRGTKSICDIILYK